MLQTNPDAWVNACFCFDCSYLKYITSTVESNLQRAELGGRPGTYNKVKAFLNIKIPTIAPMLEVLIPAIAPMMDVLIDRRCACTYVGKSAR